MAWPTATAIAIGGAAWAVLRAAHPEASQLNSLPYVAGTAHRAAGGTKRGRALAAIIIACVTGGLTIVAVLVG
jgi:hypothetical protein